jgi:hypothetical protein
MQVVPLEYPVPWRIQSLVSEKEMQVGWVGGWARGVVCEYPMYAGVPWST